MCADAVTLKPLREATRAAIFPNVNVIRKRWDVLGVINRGPYNVKGAGVNGW